MEKFVTHLSYNVDNELTMVDLCNTKQYNREKNSSFLQRWRSLTSCFPWPILENQLVHIFITNINPKIAFHLQVHYVSSFDEIIDKGVTIEKALVSKGLVKIHNKDKENDNQINDKPWFLSKNKNVISDGVIDSLLI